VTPRWLTHRVLDAVGAGIVVALDVLPERTRRAVVSGAYALSDDRPALRPRLAGLAVLGAVGVAYAAGSVGVQVLRVVAARRRAQRCGRW
jgi:hypothetical protein